MAKEPAALSGKFPRVQNEHGQMDLDLYIKDLEDMVDRLRHEVEGLVDERRELQGQLGIARAGMFPKVWEL